MLMTLPWSRHGEKVVAACCRVKSAGSPEAKLRRGELKGNQGIDHVLWRHRSHCTYFLLVL